MALVEAREALIEHVRAGCQVQRGADGDRAGQVQTITALLRHQLEQHVGAQRYATGDLDGVRIAAPQLAEHPIGVCSISAVIGARQAVGGLPAATEMHHHRSPAHPGGCIEQLTGVGRTQVTLKAMKQHEQGRIVAQGRRTLPLFMTVADDPGELDEVTIGKIENLGASTQGRAGQKSGQQGLDMAIAQAKGRAKL